MTNQWEDVPVDEGGWEDFSDDPVAAATNLVRSPEYQEIIQYFGKREPNVDYRTGAPAGMRSDFSRMDTDPERKKFLDDRVGKDQWRKDKYGAYVLSQKAANSLGVPTDKELALDEQQITLRDFADWRGDAPALLGGTAAGFATGGMGFIPGALAVGGGAMAAKSVDEIADEMRGQNLQSLSGVAGDVATEGALAMAGEGIGRGAMALGRKLMAPESMRFTPEKQQLLEKATQQGFTPNFNQITEPPIAGRAARITERIFGDPNAAENYAQAQRKIAELRRSFGSPVDTASTGETVKTSIQGKVSNFWDTSAQKYGRVDEIFDGQGVVPTARLKQQAQDIFDGLPKDADGNPVFTSPEMQQFVDQAMALPDGVTTTQMQTIRKRLYDAGYDKDLIPGLSGRDARQMAKSASDSFDDIASNVNVDPDVRSRGVAALKDAQKYYRENVKKFDDALINRITRDAGKPGAVDPEMVTDLVFKKKGATRINRVKRAMKTEDWKSIQSTAMNDLMDSVTARTDDPLVTLLSGKNLHVAMDKYGDEAMKAMFGAPKLRQMRDFADAMMVVSKKSKDQGGLVAASIAVHPLRNIGRLVGMKVMNKFFFSPSGLKYFTEGIKAPKTRAGAVALTRVSAMMATLVEDETGSPLIQTGSPP